MTDNLLVAASIVFFIAGILLARRTRFSTVKVIILSALSAIFFLLYNLYIVSLWFTGKWFDESVIFHSLYGVEGAGFSEYRLLIAGSLVFIIFGIAGAYFIFSGKDKASKINKKEANTAAPYLLVLAGIGLIPGNLYLADMLFTEQRSDFHKYYRPPHITKAPNEKRNIVFIYLEGLERTYFDQDIFPGLIKELRALEGQSTYFTNLQQTWGSGWTIAGMVTTQCGIPLVTPSHGNSMRGMDSFLQGATCLGDLLSSDGYSLSYLGGADLKFAGKGKFLASHGFEDIRGRNTLTTLVKNRRYMGPWGLYDDSLLDIAYQRYLELSQADKPFGLFMLTLDTHPPRGNPSGRCSGVEYNDGSNPVLNTVACTDILIGEFVRKINKSGYADDTIIVIASDHLSLKNTAYSFLRDADRTNLLMVIEPGTGYSREINSKGSMLDVGTIVLNILGYEGSLGLGRNLLEGEISLAANLDNVNASLKSWEETIIEFWNFPVLEDDIIIDTSYREMKIKERIFNIPALITFNKEMETSVQFQFDSSPGHKQLIDYVTELDKDIPFLWLDNCKTIKMVADNYGLCAVAGKLGSKSLKGFRINGKTTITLGSIRTAAESKTSNEDFAYNKSRIRH